MRNRELVNLRLEQLEGKMETLRYQVSNAQDLREFIQTIDQSKDLIEQVKSLINLNEITPNGN